VAEILIVDLDRCGGPCGHDELVSILLCITSTAVGQQVERQPLIRYHGGFRWFVACCVDGEGRR